MALWRAHRSVLLWIPGIQFRFNRLMTTNPDSRQTFFSDVLLDQDAECSPNQHLDSNSDMALLKMNPERLHMLRTRPFLYKIINILHDSDMVSNVKESLKIWDGVVDELLVGEALKYVEDGHTALAFFNWAAQQQGFKHNGYTYNCLLRSLELSACYPIIYNIFQRMLYINVGLTSFTFDVVLRALGKTGELDRLKLVISEMEKRKLNPHPSTYESILSCYCTNGQVEDAYDIFASVTKWPDPICYPHTFYNKFIDILTHTGNVGAAYLVFLEMIDNGYEGEAEPVGRLVTALHKAGRDRMACKVFDELARKFQTVFTGRMGKPGDSIADHYLYNARRIRKRWREEVLKPLPKPQPKQKQNYNGPSRLPRHGW